MTSDWLVIVHMSWSYGLLSSAVARDTGCTSMTSKVLQSTTAAGTTTTQSTICYCASQTKLASSRPQLRP